MEENNVYLVEWRQGVEEPKGGWPAYEASIIKIAERERTLQIKLKEIEEQLPKSDTLKRKSKPSMKLLEAAEMREEPAAKKKKSHLSFWLEHLLQEMSKTPSHVPLSHAPKPLESNADFLDHNSKIFSDGDMVPKAPSKASLSGSFKCSSDANYTQTATSMVRVLLMAAFPLEVLIHSNLKGGMSKTDCGAERRSALDKDTMAATYVAVMKRFPNVSRGALGIAVNSKLGELRLLVKKKVIFLKFNVCSLLDFYSNVLHTCSHFRHQINIFFKCYVCVFSCIEVYGGQNIFF
ncbi:uncharacterized protein LOC127429642 [Myxocyprinus asiaticus]|uniref:uncharacterized protein LOC127429642 n=1 Tax=Myxocyprinus asiaticus TaxID=70543 RepID=UPI0022237CA5|nr:uncharacterized protein LOC127429642 [Myxocyprinus asiaticus]